MRLWFDAARLQAITWANVDKVSWPHSSVTSYTSLYSWCIFGTTIPNSTLRKEMYLLIQDGTQHLGRPFKKYILGMAITAIIVGTIGEYGVKWVLIHLRRVSILWLEMSMSSWNCTSVREHLTKMKVTGKTLFVSRGFAGFEGKTLVW